MTRMPARPSCRLDCRSDRQRDEPGRRTQTTDPAKSMALLEAAGYKPGQFEITLPLRGGRPGIKQVKAKTKFGSRGGRLQGHTCADSPEGRDDTVDDAVQHQPPLHRLVLGLAERLVLVPCSWQAYQVGAGGHAQPGTSRRRLLTRSRTTSSTTCLVSGSERVGSSSTMCMKHKYYPASTWGTAVCMFMHGSKVGGMFNDNVRGMPNFKDIYVS